MGFDELFPGIESDALDLMRKLLCYDPAQRLSAEQALEHPYFKELHQKENEPANAYIEYFEFEFEQYTLDRKILRELIIDEILLYHSPEARDYYDRCKIKYPQGVLEILYQRVGAPSNPTSNSGPKIEPDSPSKEECKTAATSTNVTPENSAKNGGQDAPESQSGVPSSFNSSTPPSVPS